jgi:ketosteroid isomerase-like protein
VDFYTDDAIFVARGSAAIEGREALLDHARRMTPISSASIIAQSTDGDGDIAARLGTANWVNGPKGSEGSTTRVRFLIVWRREGDGRWRIARELLNADVQ